MITNERKKQMVTKNQSVKFVFGVLLGLSISIPLSVWGQARLESPANGGKTSGIGQIRGWRCEAPANGLIQIVIDGSIMVDAPYGSGRNDTEETCGDKDNGWGTTFNFNTIGEGEHTITASADGEQFGSATFSVGRPSEENYLRGAPGTFYQLSDFPEQGLSTVVTWQESEQNFMIVQRPSGVVPDGGTWKNQGEDFNVCWQVSNDGRKLTSEGSGCENGSSLRLNASGRTPGGLGCQIALDVSEDIEIVGGLFAYTFRESLSIDAIISIQARFDDQTNATGAAAEISSTVNACIVDFTNMLSTQ
jgi:hypothetical protein